MLKIFKLHFLFALILLSKLVQAQLIYQAGSVSGIIQDEKTHQALAYASVTAYHSKDSTFVTGVATDENGAFILSPLAYSTYYLKIALIGYGNFNTKSFTLAPSTAVKNFGTITIAPLGGMLSPVEIKDKQQLAEQKEDTIVYHADAFKTNPDASAEDLVNKMPGISSNNGSVSVNGEQVKQVLVDGKPFFGDDPTMALKNLPAEVIDKIQVFDKLSDQAQFSGFDDGNTTKTINITTKPNKSNGEFGKFYAGGGLGAENQFEYIAGGNLNIFNNDRRISILGLFNNINQQNFASQDLLGVAGSGRGGGGGGNNFLVGNQNGITTTDAVGVNYSDQYGKNFKITASAFFNSANNFTDESLIRNYINAQNSGLNYTEYDTLKNLNYNQRYNVKLEYQLDSSNSFVLWPKVNTEYNKAPSSVNGTNTLPGMQVESNTFNNTFAENAGYDFTNTLLWRHKFKKKRRTISVGLSTDLNDATGTGTNNSISRFFTQNDSLITNQHSSTPSSGYMVSPQLVYTEPVDSFGQLQLSYNPSYTYSTVNKETMNYNDYLQNYSLLDTAVSNKYQSTYIVDKAGIGYRYNKKRWMIMSGINVQSANLSGNEQYPTSFGANRTFNNLLPQATINYKFKTGNNLRIIYRASTNTPSVAQLQSVINNSNPLLLSSGNANLLQDYEHTVTIRYGKTNSRKEFRSGIFFYGYANYANNYIGNASYIPTKDTIINGYNLNRGSQFVKPVNINGYWNTRSLVTYALPLNKIKSNLSINAGINYSLTPGLINNVINKATSTTLTGGSGLSSNIGENLDFNLVYSANYNFISNSLQPQLNNNYFSGTTSFKFNWIIKKRLVINTSLNQLLVTGLSTGYNQNYYVWTVYFAYKFLKNHALELKFTVNDVLNQNQNISRTVTDTYVQDSKINVLERYYLFTLTYSIRNYKGLAKLTPSQDGENNYRHHRDQE